jgi:hypothetical protein
LPNIRWQVNRYEKHPSNKYCQHWCFFINKDQVPALLVGRENPKLISLPDRCKY